MPALFGALEFLGSTRLLADATATDTVTVAPRDLLLVLYHLVGFGTAADRLRLQFNGDTGNNYQSSFVRATAVATPVLSNIFLGSDFRIGTQNQLTGQVGALLISNVATQNKVAKSLSFECDSTVGSQLAHVLGGGGAWFNTTAQITKLRFVPHATGVILAGSGFAVFGVDL